MIPITKNITVIDELGHEYEATYPKRAKGLVKHGRARFIDEHTICLACPPNNDLEDKHMETTKTLTPETAVASIDQIIGDTAVQPVPENVEKTTHAIVSVETPAEITLGWVMQRIDRIIEDTKHIHDSIHQMAAMEETPHSMDLRAKALSTIIESREATNRQTLTLLEKMYDDLKPQKPASISFSEIKEEVSELPPVQKENFLREITGLPPNESYLPNAAFKEVKKMLEEIRTDWDQYPNEIKEAIAQATLSQLARRW